MRNLRIHYIKRTQIFTALCGAVAGTSNAADGSFNTCHFIPEQEPLDVADEVCTECASLAFGWEASA